MPKIANHYYLHWKLRARVSQFGNIKQNILKVSNSGKKFFCRGNGVPCSYSEYKNGWFNWKFHLNLHYDYTRFSRISYTIVRFIVLMLFFSQKYWEGLASSDTLIRTFSPLLFVFIESLFPEAPKIWGKTFSKLGLNFLLRINFNSTQGCVKRFVRTIKHLKHLIVQYNKNITKYLSSRRVKIIYSFCIGNPIA